MAVMPPPDATITAGITGIDGADDPLPGGTLISAVALERYGNLGEGDVVDTLQWDCTSATRLEPVDFDQVLAEAWSQYLAQGYEIAAYAIWERPMLEVVVPRQVCILGECLPIPGELCLPLIGCFPLADQVLAVAWTYRVWVLLYDLPAEGPPLAAFPLFGLALPVAWLILIVLSLLSTVFVIWAVKTGQTIYSPPGSPTPPALPQPSTPTLRNPGQNVPPRIPAPPTKPPVVPPEPAPDQSVAIMALIGFAVLSVAGAVAVSTVASARREG